jgi:Electron transfer DM13/Bacterial Ig-like domain (group 2)
MLKKLLFTFATVLTLAACSKKSADTALAIVPERLEISPVSSSILTGATTQFTLKFYNATGQLATLPAGIIWSTSNAAIATVSQQGLVTGVSNGQTEVRAAYNSIIVNALLTVAANNSQLATITLNPATIQEVKLNESATIMAEGKTNTGSVISGLSFTWQSSSNTLVEVTNAGLVTGKAYGTADITAAAMSIQSAPVMVQVIRKGTFTGLGSTGMGKLKIENGVLKLQTTPDFSVSTGAPDLRIYLGNNNNNITGAVEVASLNQRSGAQSWNVPAPTTITQFRYVIVWCKQFGGTYGVADLGL